MVFQVSRTWGNPASSQSGFPAPGSGAQTTGPHVALSPAPPWEPRAPTQGRRSWLLPNKSSSEQRGFPAPLDALQRRPRGTMPNVPPIFGGVYQNETPYYSRGANAFVPNFGRLLTNPIGAGVVARYRTQASYGPAAQYANGAIWWTSQVVPTSINLQGLTDPDELAQLFDSVTVQAVVRTTG